VVLNTCGIVGDLAFLADSHEGQWYCGVFWELCFTAYGLVHYCYYSGLVYLAFLLAAVKPLVLYYGIYSVGLSAYKKSKETKRLQPAKRKVNGRKVAQLKNRNNFFFF